MKLKEFVEIRENHDLERVIEFAWNVTIRCKKLGYPELMWQYDGLREKFISAFNHKDDKILILESDEGIEGVVCLFVELEDKYLQTMGGIYFKHDFKYTLDKLIEYLKKNFEGFEIYIGYTSRDKKILEVLDRKGKVFEKSEFFHLDEDKLISKDTNKTINIRLLNIDDFDSFSKVHDEMNPDMYWNSERIRNRFNEWRIFTYCDEGKILAYILSKVYDNFLVKYFVLLLV